MNEDFQVWHENQIRSRQTEIRELTNRNDSTVPSVSERKNLFQNRIDRDQQTVVESSSSMTNESVQVNDEHLPIIVDDTPPVIRIIDQELGELIRSQRVSSLLNSETFRRNLEQRLQSSLQSIRPVLSNTTPINSVTMPESAAGGAVNLEQLMDPNNDPELQALVSYQLVSNMLQSAFRTHLENTLWSRHIRRDNHTTLADQHDIGVNSASLNINQNHLLHSMRNEITEMRSMMRILLQSQIETHRSIRQDVSFALRSTNNGNISRFSNDVASSCVICMNSVADTVLYRCGHMCLCYACGIELRVNIAGRTIHCPVCRTPVEDILRVYGASHDLTNTNI